MQLVLPKLWPSSLHLHLTSQRWIPTQGPLCVTLLTPNSLNDSLSTSTCSSFFEIGKLGPTQAGTWHPERLHCEVSLLKRWTLPLYQKSEDELPDSKCHQNYFEISPLNIELYLFASDFVVNLGCLPSLTISWLVYPNWSQSSLPMQTL